MGKGANEVGLSRLHILHEAEASLKRLNTDYMDRYPIHGFDSLTPMEETLGALTDLVRQGKVRYIGCSNLTAWQSMKGLGISELQHLEKFVTLQAYYSLAGRELERELVPMMLDQKIGVASVEHLVEPATRGDPLRPLLWTSKSLRHLATALRDKEHSVCLHVIADCLRELGYSLQANSKTREGSSHVDRDAQFQYQQMEPN